MKIITSILLIFTMQLVLSQSKTELIDMSEMDSVIVFEGGESILEGPSLIIKYTANPQDVLTALSHFHTRDASQLRRSKDELYIPNTSLPYWVYGSYSVRALLTAKDDYTLIEISFKAYNNPTNYRMYSAEDEYQILINQLLKK